MDADIDTLPLQPTSISIDDTDYVADHKDARLFARLYDSAELKSFASMRPLLLEYQQWQRAAKGKSVSQAWVCFRRYDRADQVGVGAGCCDCFLGWLNQTYAEQYKHVELAFLAKSLVPGVEDDFFSFTVDLPAAHMPGSGQVRTAHRERGRRGTYNTDRWSCYHLNRFSELEVLALYVYCSRQLGKPINTSGLYWNFLPLLRQYAGDSQREESTYFCSQLVAAALAWVQPSEYAYIDPRRTTPLSLYQILSRKLAVEESGEWRSVDVLSL